MHDVVDIIDNIERVYDSNTSFQVLKDFERVLDELDLYVYKNWEDGELASGPKIGRHWVTCRFMWPYDKMPDPMGGKRLLDYDCKVGFLKDFIVKPRKIRTPDDVRPGTQKGKLDREPIWIVEIRMPKKLIADIWTGYQEQRDYDGEAVTPEAASAAGNPAQPADAAAAAPAPAAPAPAATEGGVA
jgi:hypothetical protein